MKQIIHDLWPASLLIGYTVIGFLYWMDDVFEYNPLGNDKRNPNPTWHAIKRGMFWPYYLVCRR